MDDAVGEFLVAVSRGWDAESFSALEALLSRWATTQPPPVEALFDVVTIIAKYGKQAAQAGLDAGDATRRIMIQLDRFPTSADDAVRQLILLEKSFVTGVGNRNRGLTRLDLDWLARNMEARTLGDDTDLVEALTRSTRIGPEDTRTDVNVNLFRRMQEWRRRPDSEAEIAELALHSIKPEIGNIALAKTLDELSVAVPTTNLRVTTPFGTHFLDAPAVPSSDVAIEVLILRADEVVKEQRVLRSNELTVFEVKMFAAETWTKSPKAPVDEVVNGFLFVDAGGTGTGNSLVATTPDILDRPDTLRTVLENIRRLNRLEFSERSAIYLLPENNSFYNAQAFGLLRGLVD